MFLLIASGETANAKTLIFDEERFVSLELWGEGARVGVPFLTYSATGVKTTSTMVFHWGVHLNGEPQAECVSRIIII